MSFAGMTVGQAEQYKKTLTEPARNWPSDFSHEDGTSLRNCVVCYNDFCGLDYRIICRVCAFNPVNT